MPRVLRPLLVVQGCRRIPAPLPSFFWGAVAASCCYFDQVAVWPSKVAIVGIGGFRPGRGGMEGVAGMPSGALGLCLCDVSVQHPHPSRYINVNPLVLGFCLLLLLISDFIVV